MTSFELEIDEKSLAGSSFMALVAREIRRAVAAEKSARKLTQQVIAEKIGTSRAVVNREIQGLENLTARRIGELLWAIEWEPCFEVRKIETDDGCNEFSEGTRFSVTDAEPQPDFDKKADRAAGTGQTVELEVAI